jgi:PAS domain S-box-containing protein
VSGSGKPRVAPPETDQYFKLLVESVLDYGIFMLDPEGRVASWNSGAQRIKGWSADEIIGRHFSTFYPEDAVAKGWPAHELSVASREGRFEDEGWRVRKDGSQFWANVVITAVHDGTGRLVGFAKVTRDLTDRKRIEELEAAEQRINEFLAMLGHELRNPLAPIRNAVAILRAAPRGGADAEARGERAASIIERQVHHLTRLVDDLLDVSRITSGKIALRAETLDLAGPVHSAIEAARPGIERKRQTLDFQSDGAPLPVAGDATRLTQVVLNLLDNASKYTPAEGRIALSLERLERQAVIRVRDDGIGIARELLPRMFDLFVQGERGLDRSQGGLGLGLTLVRRLVSLHGGTVSATSPGKGLGSEFEVRLPLAPGAVAEDAPPDTAGGASPTPYRGLVVDDNTDSAETMATLLGIWGHEVHVAHRASDALRAADEHHPQVVLLDLGLPDISGYEVAERLRAMPGLEYAVIIAMTGYGQEEDRRRTRDAGFAHHLIKPVQPDALKEILSSLEGLVGGAATSGS